MDTIYVSCPAEHAGVLIAPVPRELFAMACWPHPETYLVVCDDPRGSVIVESWMFQTKCFQCSSTLHVLRPNPTVDELTVRPLPGAREE